MKQTGDNIIKFPSPVLVARESNKNTSRQIGQIVELIEQHELDGAIADMFELAGLVSDLRMALYRNRQEFFRFQLRQAIEVADRHELSKTMRLLAEIGSTENLVGSQMVGSKLDRIEQLVEHMIDALLNSTELA